jgi:hypothetical protein
VTGRISPAAKYDSDDHIMTSILPGYRIRVAASAHLKWNNIRRDSIRIRYKTCLSAGHVTCKTDTCIEHQLNSWSECPCWDTHCHSAGQQIPAVCATRSFITVFTKHKQNEFCPEPEESSR